MGGGDESWRSVRPAPYAASRQEIVNRIRIDRPPGFPGFFLDNLSGLPSMLLLLPLLARVHSREANTASSPSQFEFSS